MPAAQELTALRFALTLALALGAGGVAAAVERPGTDPSAKAAKSRGLDGARLYRAQCAPCHGEGGRGDGPAARFIVRPPRDLRSGVLGAYETDELVARIRDGRALPIELDVPAMRRRARDVEAIAAWLERLPDVDWAKVERGNEIYLDRCEICHGPFGRPDASAPLPPGVQRLPRDLASAELQSAFGDRELLEVVRHGRAGMPAIPGLETSDSDAEVLAAYVRSLSPGREQYAVWCAGCHGEDGRGVPDLPDAASRPSVVFDRAWLRAQDPEVLRSQIWHMLEHEKASMPHFSRRLSEAEARAIVAHLRRADAERPPPTPTPH